MISVISILRFQNNGWNQELNFYHVNLSEVDFNVDSRFISNKNRKDAKLLEVLSNDEAKEKYKLATF